MTLVELTVVLVILSLLAVAVLPALNRSPNKSLLRDTAATVQGHIAQGMSKAIGNRTGYGVWFEPDAGISGGSTATTLAFCQGVTTGTGSTTLTVTSATAMTLSSAFSPAQFPAGSLISFAGYPYEYALDASSSPAQACFRSDAGQTVYNTSFPAVSSTYRYLVSIPPTRTTGFKTTLRGNACLDLGCSTIGIMGYSTRLFTSTSGTTVDIPTAALALTFDSTGRAMATTFASQFAPSVRSVVRFDSETPIALLVGLRDQVGKQWNTSPNDDDPGSNLERRDAYWVVYDPRSSTSFVVENYVPPMEPDGSLPSAGSLFENIRRAQRFIRQALMNRNDLQ